MKISAKVNPLARKIATFLSLLAMLVLTVVIVYTIVYPKIVKVDSDVVEIRLPGEFEGHAEILYNAEYVTQEQNGTVIKLIFEKQGYYFVSIYGEYYIFEVMNIKSPVYVIDLISSELSTIKTMVSCRILIESGIIDAFLLLIVIITKIVIRVKLVKKAKKSKLKEERTENISCGKSALR